MKERTRDEISAIDRGISAIEASSALNIGANHIFSPSIQLGHTLNEMIPRAEFRQIMVSDYLF